MNRAQNGEAAAQFNLGHRYRRGIGLQKDSAKAAMWFRKAAEQGDIGAEYEFGAMLVAGEGVPRDMREGQKWLAKANSDNPQNSFRQR